MLDFLVEQKLSEAVSRGERGQPARRGRPLDLQDDALVPERIESRYYAKVVRRLSRR
jgi:hypothetical protein